MYEGLRHSSSTVTLCRVWPLSKVFSPALNNGQAVSYMHYSSLGIALRYAVLYGEVFINA